MPEPQLNVRVDVFVHGVPVAPDTVLHNLITALTHKVDKIMSVLDDVEAKVEALTTVKDSVIQLLTDIKAKLDAAIAAGADPVRLQKISDALGTDTQALSDAVVANTPAAP